MGFLKASYFQSIRHVRILQGGEQQLLSRSASVVLCGGSVSAVRYKQIGCNHRRWQMKSTDAGVVKTQGILLKIGTGSLKLPRCYSDTTAHLLRGDGSPLIPSTDTSSSHGNPWWFPPLPVNVPLQTAFAVSHFPFCLTPTSVQEPGLGSSWLSEGSNPHRMGLWTLVLVTTWRILTCSTLYPKSDRACVSMLTGLV